MRLQSFYAWPTEGDLMLALEASVTRRLNRSGLRVYRSGSSRTPAGDDSAHDMMAPAEDYRETPQTYGISYRSAADDHGSWHNIDDRPEPAQDQHRRPNPSRALHLGLIVCFGAEIP